MTTLELADAAPIRALSLVLGLIGLAWFAYGVGEESHLPKNITRILIILAGYLLVVTALAFHWMPGWLWGLVASAAGLYAIYEVRRSGWRL